MDDENVYNSIILTFIHAIILQLIYSVFHYLYYSFFYSFLGVFQKLVVLGYKRLKTLDKMENLKTFENSLLKLSNISPQLKNYLRGWDLALKNFKEFDRDAKPKVTKKKFIIE